ncbi:IS66 family insertion sequence element accessory protein TnpB [Holdemanella porci]|uniref:IS66 family insertion sequence element accessory protein TnpB n=2 Tax=Holdemanella porci TaxID=2652276 RepID=UPI003AF4E547
MFGIMISFDDIPEIYIVKNVKDLRKGIDGYASIVQNLYQIIPFQDALFIFCNKHRNKIKCLYWDGNGFWLLYKRLEKGHFQFPIRDDGIATITKQQLRWLLEGLKMEQKKAFENESYKYA